MTLPVSFDREQAEVLRSSAGAELRAPASFERPFLDDGTIILREAKDDVPGWLWTAAIALIFAIYAVFITAIAVAVARLGRSGRPDLTGSSDATGELRDRGWIGAEGPDRTVRSTTPQP